ncbi:molybdopterin-binding protein, partial [Erwinia amylovora]|uniref:molybdopterin-binding protein n=1 Tax=Erwinia amylovora TaxID=552 RepID=UPI0020BEA048
LINGGTGFNDTNATPEAIGPLDDREVAGFGELFRMISWEDIATSTLQSRALAGIANGTLIFAIPGSSAACQLAWERIIQHQLDARTRPCHFVSHLKKT